MNLEEVLISCPYCWEEIALEIDLSAGSQAYAEDCSVCCQPIAVKLSVDEASGEWQVEVAPEND